jgi:hypothetical protein
VLTNHLDQISINEVVQTVNRESAAPYTTRQVETILEVQKELAYFFFGKANQALIKLCHVKQLSQYLINFLLCFQRMQDANRIMIRDGIVRII